MSEYPDHEEFPNYATHYAVPRWLYALVVAYLIMGASGGLWFGIDRLSDW